MYCLMTHERIDAASTCTVVGARRLRAGESEGSSQPLEQ